MATNFIFVDASLRVLLRAGDAVAPSHNAALVENLPVSSSVALRLETGFTSTDWTPEA